MQKSLQKRIIRVAKVLEKLSGNFVPVKLKNHDWVQITGNKSMDKNGFSIAKSDGNTIDIRYIQPVRATVGDKKALGVGFPFWSSEAHYNLKDLQSNNAIEAIKAAGITDELSSMSPEKRAFEIADAMLGYGIDEKEGPSGWAKDVIPNYKQDNTWGFLAKEDKAFKQLLDNTKMASYKIAGDIAKPQKCKFCKQPATKAYVWAEGRAYIPVCKKHEQKANDTITKKNEDSIDEVRDIPIE